MTTGTEHDVILALGIRCGRRLVPGQSGADPSLKEATLGNPISYFPLPSGSDFPSFYTRLDSITDASGNPITVITPDSGTITISGITDASPTSNSTVAAFLFRYGVSAGLPEQTSVAASSDAATPVDLDLKDGKGNELYAWSVTMNTAGLAPGVYALQSFVHTEGFVTTNGVPTELFADEPDQGTVTVQEFEPFTYVVHEDTKVVSVGAAQTDTSVFLSGATGDVQISTDGRYAVWTDGDRFERDLQTGATVDLTTTGGSAPVLAADLSPTVTEVGTPDPYGPSGNGGYGDITYPTFTEGGVTFGTIPDFDFNANNGSQNPLPTATDANGDTAVLSPFGTSPTMAGYAAAASDNGNAVLTIETSNVSYFTPYDSNGITASPQYYVTYRDPAPTLSIDPVDGTDQFAPGASSVTLTGTSDAIGQVVEIDFGHAGAEVGTATVQANGTWSYTFDASAITGSSLFIEASVTSALGTPAEVSETAAISTQTPAKVTGLFGLTPEDSPAFGPGEALTIYVNVSAQVFVSGTPTLTLGNGGIATYSSGPGPHTQLQFTYVPPITDSGSTDLSVTGLSLSGGASITDANGNPLQGPFADALGIALQTVPEIVGVFPTIGSDDFATTSNMPIIAVRAEAGETVTVFDNGIAIGSAVTSFGGGATLLEEGDVTPTVALPNGTSVLTAVAVDGSGHISALSGPVAITVGTAAPDVFEDSQKAVTGALSGDYLWSDAANWSAGVPTSGSSVAMAAVGVDDIAGLNLNSLSVAPLHATIHGELTVTADLTVATLLVTADAEIDLDGATMTVTGASTVDGAIVVDPSTLTFKGPVTGSGTIEIAANSTVTFDGPVDAGETVDFVSNSGTLIVGDAAQFDATIVGSGTEMVICYLHGTRVLTPTGEVPIETLAAGDRLITRFGGVQAIRWIGRQSFAARFIGRNRDQWPVRIAAGALGDGRPARDLLVSPGHSMLIDGALILARNLINGVSVTQSRPVSDVHYLQVEFETQDCILAEGAWSESYADADGLRAKFHNAHEFRERFPEYRSPPEPQLCAPRPQTGPALDAALRPLVARASDGLTPGPLRGWIDAIEPTRVRGWALDEDHPDLPVLLDIRLHNRLLGTVLACEYRGDLVEAGRGRGYSGFELAIELPAGSLGHVTIARSVDGAAIPAPRRHGLRGHVDGWRGRVLYGWAQDPDDPETPVSLDILIDGRSLRRFPADLFRADLSAAGLGSGCHGFETDLPASAQNRTVEVRRVGDGSLLGLLRAQPDANRAAA